MEREECSSSKYGIFDISQYQLSAHNTSIRAIAAACSHKFSSLLLRRRITKHHGRHRKTTRSHGMRAVGRGDSVVVKEVPKGDAEDFESEIALIKESEVRHHSTSPSTLLYLY